MTDQSTNPAVKVGAITALDAGSVKAMFTGALEWLKQHYEEVNALNVFPVPDGDTGTNMLLTLRAAVKQAGKVDDSAAGAVMKALAKGALYGSAGNSGTLLSEIINGWANVVADKIVLTADDIAHGFREGVNLAYKATDHPVEGTILTVARETADVIEQTASTTSDVCKVLDQAVRASLESVARTPTLLPILRKAGVVDSGGRGLAFILEGMALALNGVVGIPTEKVTEEVAVPSPQPTVQPQAAERTPDRSLDSGDQRGYPYDVQFVCTVTQPIDLDTVKAKIGAMGDSMVVTRNGDTIKVHIHVYDPGEPLSYGATLGRLESVIVEDMQAQYEEFAADRLPADNEEAPEQPDAAQVAPGQIAVIAVALGSGFQQVLRSVGCAGIVEGGATMNPSVQDFLTQAEKFDTDKFILFPNDKNVIRAAQKAADLLVAEGKQAVVVPTTAIPMAITAMISAFDPNGTLDQVANAMREAAGWVGIAEITTAVRSVEMDGLNIAEGQIIGLVDGKLAAATGDRYETLLACLGKMDMSMREHVTLYYGADVMLEQADSDAEQLRQRFKQTEFEVVNGGQPHYLYIVGAE